VKLDSQTETKSPGTSSDEMTSTHLPSLKACTLYGVMLIVLNSVKVRTRFSSAWYYKYWHVRAHLENDGALKDNQHERCEQGVVPVLVQAPQRHAEHLEDEEGRDGMLGEELGEFRDGDMAFILAVRSLEDVERRQSVGGGLGRSRRVRENALGLLEGGQWRRRVARVRDEREGLGDG